MLKGGASHWSGLERSDKILEARVGIEPTHKGFADLSLTTWVPRPVSLTASTSCFKAFTFAFERGKIKKANGAGDGI